MEEIERTYDWKSRWGDDCFEYFQKARESFHNWWAEFEEPAEPQEPKTAKEKLDQAEVAEYEVLDDAPLELGYAI